VSGSPIVPAKLRRPTLPRKAAGLFRFRGLRVMLIALGLLVVWLVALALDIVTYATVRDDGPTDAAIVLGAAVMDTEPSPVFEERIKHAIDLYQQGRVKALIFTGAKAMASA
jgi:vancomycin permeability regulator SanA